MKRFLPFLLVLLLRNVAFGQHMPDTAHVVAWWPICYEMTDHRHGLYNLSSIGVSYTFDVNNSANSALDFDGVTSKAYYPTNIPVTNAFTYACWIRPTSAQNSIIFYNGDPSLNGFGLTMSNGAGGAGTKVSILFGGVAANQVPTTVSLNQWHHLVLTRSGNTYSLTVDTVLQGSFVSVFATPLTNQFTLGMDDVTNTRGFEGRIDDIAIYNKVLPLDSIKRLYHFDPVSIPISLGSDLIICDTATICLDTIPDTTLYYRAYGNTAGTSTIVTPAGCITAPVPVLGAPVTYTVTASKILGCVASSSVTVKHVNFVVDLGPDLGKCIGDEVTLHATGGSTATYLWSTGSTNDSLNVMTAGSYSVIVDSGACIAKDTVNIAFSPPPIINLAADTASCDGLPVLLGPTGTYVDSSFLWTGPGGVFGHMDTFTANSSGRYYVTVTQMGCSRLDSIDVTVVFDTFTLKTGNTALCHGAGLPVSLTGPNWAHYQWTPTAGIAHPADTLGTPTINADTSAMYYVTVSIGACHKVDSFFLDIQPSPIHIAMGGNRNTCRHDSLRLAPSVTPAWYTHYIYDWTPGTYLNDSTASVVSYSSTDTGTYKLYLTVSTPAGCTSRDSMMIFVHTDSLATLDTAMNLCQGLDATLKPNPDKINTGEGPLTYAWHNGRDFIDSTSATPTVSPHASGNYIGIVTSKWGCHDTLKARVNLLPSAMMYLTDSVMLHPGESYQISPETNCSRFTWYPGLGLTDTTISNPVASPFVSTKYIVTAITEDGCRLTDSIKVVIDPISIIDAPNAFAPGGINNRFRAIRKGAAVLNYFRIFDRWGNMVYESKDIDAGWDGMYKNIAQPAGVYVYVIEAVTDQGKIFRKQGNVTLLR